MKGIMIQGTASSVGKSMLTTALCRLLTNRGYRVSPFKAQNMSNRTVVFAESFEMASSQYEQARAAKRSPEKWMNPVLLKPSRPLRTEVFLQGKSFGWIDGANFKDLYYQQALSIIEESLKQAGASGDYVVMEGAGSPVEMNLKDRDLANMAIAELADLPVVLVADIEKGGVFATIVGTLELLTEKERSRVKGIIINKFIGKPSLFAEGIEWLENKTNIPVLGVIPYIDLQLEEEETAGIQQNNHSNEKKYDQLADLLESNADVAQLLEIMEGIKA